MSHKKGPKSDLLVKWKEVMLNITNHHKNTTL